MLVEFSVTCIFHRVWENFFNLWCSENALNLCIFTHALVPHSKLQVEFFENLFPLRRKGWMEETMICFIKIHSENMNMTWNISWFIFCTIFNFSKCDGFTVLWIISSNSVALSLLHLLCNHGNLTLKITSEKIATLEVYQER